MGLKVIIKKDKPSHMAEHLAVMRYDAGTAYGQRPAQLEVLRYLPPCSLIRRKERHIYDTPAN